MLLSQVCILEARCAACMFEPHKARQGKASKARVLMKVAFKHVPLLTTQILSVGL